MLINKNLKCNKSFQSSPFRQEGKEVLLTFQGRKIDFFSMKEKQFFDEEKIILQ